MTRRRWTLRLIAAVFWLSAFALSVSTYRIVNDHFDRISRARQIARYGALPFRDFFDPGYFMTEFSSAGLQLLLGDNLLGEMLLNTVFIASGATVVFVLARRVSGSILAGLAAALLALLSMPRAYDFDKALFFPLGIALCWRYVDRPSVRRAVELGAGIAAGALFRYDTGVYLGAGAIVAMSVLHWREPRVFAQRIGLFAGTSVVSGLIVVLPVLGFSGVPDAVDQIATYAVRERARTEIRQIPRFSFGDLVGRASISPPSPAVTVRWSHRIDDASRMEAEAKYGLHDRVVRDTPEDRTYRYTMNNPSPTVIRELVTDPRVDDTAGIDRARQSLPAEPLWTRAQRLVPPLQWRVLPNDWNEDNAKTFLFYFLWGLPCIGVLGLVLARNASSVTTQEVARVGSVIVVCLALNAFVLRDPISARVGGIAGPATVLATWLGTRAWRSSRLVLRLGLSAAVVILFALAVWSLARLTSWSERLVPEIANPSHVRVVARQLSTSPARPELVSGGPFGGMVRYLRECTSPTDRILARWFVPELYFFAQRGFAAGMVATFGGHWSEPRFQTRSVQALESESVPIVISLAGDERVLDEYPVLTRYIDEHYKSVGRTNFDSPNAEGDYLVLVRKDRPPIRRHPLTALPCFN